MMQKIRWFLLIAGVTVVLVIAIWNNGIVTVKFPFFHRELPLSLLILISVGFGFLSGAGMTYSMLRSRKKPETKNKTPDKQSEAVGKLAPDQAESK